MDKSTFQQKLQQYKDMVYRIAYTYLRNTADAVRGSCPLYGRGFHQTGDHL